MQRQYWDCPKCRNREYETDQLSATGGGMSRFFNVQSKRYTTVTCTTCSYTEIYRTEASTLSNVLDFFGN